MDENELDRLLRALAGEDESAALAAFENLRASSEERFRIRLSRLSSAVKNELDDIVELSFWKIWINRKKLTHLTSKTWPAYLLRIGINCAMDYLRIEKRERQKSLAMTRILQDQYRQEDSEFRTRMERKNDLERILHRANALWLGMDRTASFATHQRQILAAQFHYLDDMPVDEIIDLLPCQDGDARLTLPILNAWLKHERIIRALAYSELFYTKDRLTWHLLGKAGPVSAIELDALTCAASDAGNTMCPEVALILWRYRYGMRPNDILMRSDCTYDCGALMSALARVEQRLPFLARMENLYARLTPAFGAERVGKALATPGVWQRLAFQYFYLEDLALPDVCQRLQPAAQRAGYSINAANLNVWLCGKRLLKSLGRDLGEDMTS